MVGEIMPEEKEKEEQKKETSKEEQMKSVAEIYGITLSDIEEVHLPNGKEYFKFYNPEDKNLKMIENRDMDRNISEQFKDIQKTLQASQGEDGLANARAVFDYQMQYQNVELTLIPIRELNNNRSSYRYLLDEIDENQRKAIRVLLQNIDYLDLEYINIANAIAVDKQNRVIHSWYNVATGKCELKAAEVRNYENEQKGVDSNGYTVDIPDEEFDHLVEDVDVASDTPTIQEAGWLYSYDSG